MQNISWDKFAADNGAPSRDALGWRAKFGVIAPSTNTVVEPEFHAMSVPGVTAHMSRIHIRDMDMADDDAMNR
ncbi:MAG: maleate isomerase, partial [Glaciecola sp.]